MSMGRMKYKDLTKTELLVLLMRFQKLLKDDPSLFTYSLGS